MMKVLIIPGLTLPEVSADDLERIHAAAGPDAEVRVTGMKAAHDEVADADVVLGLVPESLFARARHWTCRPENTSWPLVCTTN